MQYDFGQTLWHFISHSASETPGIFEPEVCVKQEHFTVSNI